MTFIVGEKKMYIFLFTFLFLFLFLMNKGKENSGPKTPKKTN